MKTKQNVMGALAAGTCLVLSGCATAHDSEAELHREEQLRASHPALYQLERERAQDPATRELQYPSGEERNRKH